MYFVDRDSIKPQIWHDEEESWDFFSSPKNTVSMEYAERVLGPDLVRDEVLVQFLADAVAETVTSK
jgi:hypothetical protein